MSFLGTHPVEGMGTSRSSEWKESYPQAGLSCEEAPLAIERVKELYGCPSDVAAIRLALRMVAMQEVAPVPKPH